MKHYIIVKWNKEMPDKNRVIGDISTIFNKTLSIKGIHDFEIIQNVVDRPNRYDLIIRIDMDRGALEEYDKCDAHHEWKDKYSKYIESKSIIDTEE